MPVTRKSTPSARAWHDTSIEEMKVFIGILILIGIIKLPWLIVYDSHVPHAPQSRSKRDFQQFRYEVATELIGHFRGRQHIGRPRSLEHMSADRLGQWPKHLEKKSNCVV